ncbi:hypothetical protein DPEC_G00069080 [Dallia pectoralis]|uniref:Uncharacterized protein n=1 Tax=Dallia pectoralis TaxID=75939 RepID=A0ACC2H1U3_DALPE|nr:hypothetical protein DPEC_G00069080 [Dallia pectoralis]
MDVQKGPWSRVSRSRLGAGVPRIREPDRDWQTGFHATIVKWLCAAPPASFFSGLDGSRDARGRNGPWSWDRVEADSGRLEVETPRRGEASTPCAPVYWRALSENVWTRGTSKVVNKGLSVFKRVPCHPIANLIVIVEPGQWYATPCRDAGDRVDDSAGTVSVDESLAFHNEVCSATEFILAVACRMLSGEVHEELR